MLRKGKLKKKDSKTKTEEDMETTVIWVSSIGSPKMFEKLKNPYSINLSGIC